jgi:hypothetical protein
MKSFTKVPFQLSVLFLLNLVSVSTQVVFKLEPALAQNNSCPIEDINTPVNFPPSNKPLIVRKYDLSTTFQDNGTLLDGDVVSVAVTGRKPPSTNVTTMPILIPLANFANSTNNSQLDFPIRLPSYVNQLNLTSISGGVTPPTTVGTSIRGMEKSPTSTNDSVDLNRQDFSHSLLPGRTKPLQIECRRVKSSKGSNSATLSTNLEDMNYYATTYNGTRLKFQGKSLSKHINWFGERLPCGTQAHHIVTSFNNVNITSVGLSQNILRQCSIDINDPDNGVPLPQNAAVPVPGHIHNGSHSAGYHNAVYNHIRSGYQNQKCDGVRKALGTIRQELQNRTFVWP